MRDQMQADMAEATRLTHEGRLAEATAVIQRAPGGTYAPEVSSDGPGDGAKSTEAAFYVVDEAPRPATPPQPGSSISAPVTEKSPPSGRVAVGDLLSKVAATIQRATGNGPDTATTLPAPEPPLNFRGVSNLLNDLPSLLPGGLAGATVGVDTPSVIPAGGSSLRGLTQIKPGHAPTSCTSRAATSSGRRRLWSSCSTAVLRIPMISPPAPT